MHVISTTGPHFGTFLFFFGFLFLSLTKLFGLAEGQCLADQCVFAWRGQSIVFVMMLQQSDVTWNRSVLSPRHCYWKQPAKPGMCARGWLGERRGTCPSLTVSSEAGWRPVAVSKRAASNPTRFSFWSGRGGGAVGATRALV